MAIHHWRLAVQGCPPDSHEFMTLVQSCWAALIEHNEVRGANNFLLETFPMVAEVHMQELWEMVELTFQVGARRFAVRRDRP